MQQIAVGGVNLQPRESSRTGSSRGGGKVLSNLLQIVHGHGAGNSCLRRKGEGTWAECLPSPFIQRELGPTFPWPGMASLAACVGDLDPSMSTLGCDKCDDRSQGIPLGVVP